MKILMVCLGNICRSPLAEGIMQHKVALLGKNISVDSCGISDWHQGEKPDRRSIEVAKKYNLDISNQRSRPFSKNDFENFDLIFAMDKSNMRDINSFIRTEEDKLKVHLLLEYADMNTYEVPDPYFDGGIQGFEYVYKLLDKACDKALTKILTDYKL